MKLIKSTYLLLFLIIYFPSHGQKANSGAIIGKVISQGQSVGFINIFIEGTTIGTTTDHQGHFKLLNLPEGTHRLTARGVGFKSSSQLITVGRNHSQEVSFEVEEDVLNLDGVVITASRNEINRIEAPLVVNILSSKQFETTQAVCVVSSLDFVPGLRVENNCQNCGFSQVRMNGLEGPYSQMLINSRPIFSGLAGVYGLELFPTSMVDRVEVVRGGGSAMYGGNAIAGTVNIITKDPYRNSFSVDSQTGIIGMGNSEGGRTAIDQVLNLNASIVDKDLNNGLFLYGIIRNRDWYDENGDGFSEMVLMENLTFGFRGFHKLSQTSKISLDFYRIDEYRRGGNMFDHLPHESDITEMVDHKITGTNLSYDLFTHPVKLNKLSIYAAAQRVHRDSYYGAQQDLDAYGRTSDWSTSIGSQYTLNINSTLSFMAGVDNNFNTLKDTKLGANGNPNSLIVDQYVNTIGSFIQKEWKSELLKLSLGLRYDHYLIKDMKQVENNETKNLSGNVLAPRVNLLFSFAPTLQYRIAYSTGYRTPQIFDEDLHIESSGARTIVHRNSHDLRQETSHSFTSSINFTRRFNQITTSLLAEGFYTQLNDPFSNEFEFDEEDKTLYQTRQNSEDGAHVAGVNLEFNSIFSKAFTLQMGYTFQTSKYETAKPWGEEEHHTTRNFLRTPDQYGFLTLDYQPLKKLKTSFTTNYTGRMYVPHYGLSGMTAEESFNYESGNMSFFNQDRLKEVEALSSGDVIAGERLERSEEFLIFGFRVSYEWPMFKGASTQLSFGVQNVFNQIQKSHDKGIFRDAGYVYGPSQPRTLNFGIKIGNF